MTCVACDDTRVYGGEPCVLCCGEHCHDPNIPSGAAAIYALLGVVILVILVLVL